MGTQKARPGDSIPPPRELLGMFIESLDEIQDLPGIEDALTSSESVRIEDRALGEHRTYMQIAMDDAMAIIENMVHRIKEKNPKYRVTEELTGIYRDLYSTRAELKKKISHAAAKQKLLNNIKTGRWHTETEDDEKNVPPYVLPLSVSVVKGVIETEEFQSLSEEWTGFADIITLAAHSPTGQAAFRAAEETMDYLIAAFSSVSRLPSAHAIPEFNEDGDDELILQAQAAMEYIPQEYHYIVEDNIQKYRDNGFQDSEHGSERKYLNYIARLPWNKKAKNLPTLAEARETLEASHYGLKKPKKAIQLYLSDLIFRGGEADKVPMLCLNGLPGTGKTTLGNSIAKALNRPFFRIAAGSAHDSTQMKGMRKSYIGADLGEMLKTLFRLGVKNPAIFLDEVDKVQSAGINGNPFAPLMEILDPEQNREFIDDFLEIPFDLSQVLFIIGTNNVSVLPAPLRGRMEIIEVPGYLPHEKKIIADNYIMPRIMGEYNEPPAITFEDGIIEEIIDNHTSESGMRQLERHLRTLVKTGTSRLLESDEKSVLIRKDELPQILDSPYIQDRILNQPQCGHVNGLYVADMGGGILPIETAFAPRLLGEPPVKITGNLHKVMTESAQNAITTALNLAEEYLGRDVLKQKIKDKSIHVNAPHADSKDGPSAGTALTLAIFSLLTDIPVSNTVALTGEITLKHRVLAIGGVREKLAGAMRAGVTKALVPAQNQHDIAALDQEIKDGIEIVPVHHMKEVLREGLAEDPFPDWKLDLGVLEYNQRPPAPVMV